MAAKKLEHSIKGLKDSHQEDDHQEMAKGWMLIPWKPPMEKEEKKRAQREPFEKFDLCRKRHKGDWELWI